ncbi:alpha/beta hydrolase [Nonomuraea sediminis]|uniref:alpha/beta hydrolase n=1 Tax=Nonomuraea sediminis TaxID=2835864 RepID=UPI001BDDA84A|nr:alpha/beta hydrolase [Nonomuraea sediminis]
MRKRLWLLTAALALVLPAAPAAARTPVAEFAPCVIPGFENLDCAKIDVPVDYRRPGGPKIKVSVARRKHTVPDDQFQGVLLANPGGPGASGLGFALGVRGMDPAVAASYDLIGFDPRGVGTSEPAVACSGDYLTPVRPDYVPADRSAERVWVDRARRVAELCRQKYGWLLPHLTTVNAARDLDVIRQSLGQDRINYLGFSYGTYLGATYATLFPTHVRRLVLDSIVRPSGIWYQDNIDQNHSFEARIHDYFAWVARFDATYHLGTTEEVVEKAYYDLRAKLTAAPAGGVVGPDELDDTFLANAYRTRLWPILTPAFAGGSADALVDAFQNFGAQDDNAYSMYLSVECSDARWPRAWPVWHRDMTESYKTARFATWNNAWFNAPCAFWPVHGQQPLPVKGRPGLPDVLFLQDVSDGPTPFPGGVEVHGLFPSSHLVVEQGGKTHGLIGRGNACIDGVFNAYMRDGTVPGDGATCPGTPEPQPQAVQRLEEPEGLTIRP